MLKNLDPEKYDQLYTTIIHKYRIKHCISNNDYCIANAIYNLSTNPASKFPGWYYGKIETLSAMFQFSRATAYNSVQKLIEKGLVEKDNESGFLRTTKLWWDDFVNNAIIKKSKN